MRLIYDLSLDWTSKDLGIVVVNVVSQMLHVFSGLMFKFRVSEHIADLFKVIRGLQANEAISSAFVLNSAIFFFGPFLSTSQIGSNLGTAWTATTLLGKIWKVARNYEIQIS